MGSPSSRLFFRSVTLNQGSFFVVIKINDDKPFMILMECLPRDRDVMGLW